MVFNLQKENDMDIDTYIVLDIIKSQKMLHEYYFWNLNEFANADTDYMKFVETGIPIGSIGFVEKWLKRFHNIDGINPIEVPECLRKEEFLKRRYQILPADEVPRKGEFFLKDVSRLKTFGQVINANFTPIDDLFKKPSGKHDHALHLDQTHLYQVSDVVQIQSEYRVYVQDNNIEAIANYDGDPCIFPDAKLLNKMINIYSMQDDCPKAYTMDVAVNWSGTFLLEVHPWISVGLYNSLWNGRLLYAYRDGINYVLNYNTEPQVFRL